MESFKQIIVALSGFALFTFVGSAFAVIFHIEEGLSGGDVNALAAAGTAVGAGETTLYGELEVGAALGGTIPDALIDEDVFTFTLDSGAFTAAITNYGFGIGQPADPAMTLVEFVGGNWIARAATDPNINDVDLAYNPASTGLFALIINQYGNDPRFIGVNFYDPANLGLPWNNMSGVVPAGSSFTYTITTSGIDEVNLSYMPIPSAVWLFGSGFLGLIGVARRKV